MQGWRATAPRGSKLGGGAVRFVLAAPFCTRRAATSALAAGVAGAEGGASAVLKRAQRVVRRHACGAVKR